MKMKQDDFQSHLSVSFHVDGRDDFHKVLVHHGGCEEIQEVITPLIILLFQIVIP